MHRLLWALAPMLTAGLFSAQVSAATVTIDFSGAPAILSEVYHYPKPAYHEEGFTVDRYLGDVIVGNAPVLPSKAVLVGPGGGGISFFGDNFTLHSFDVGFLSGLEGIVRLSGYRDDVQILNEELSIPEGPRLPEFTTVEMDAAWIDLDRVSITVRGAASGYSEGSALDNIVVSSVSTTAPVPVPAAAWLFGSALAGFGWLRRKHTA